MDAGTYLITDTLKIPAGSFVVGELWSNIVASGSKFASASSPHVAVQVGSAGDTAATEISDLVFTTTSGMAGAIVVEWNVGSAAQGGAAMWDSHVRLGGYKGSGIQVSNCGTGTSHPTAACTSSYLALHLTSTSSAYLEVRSTYCCGIPCHALTYRFSLIRTSGFGLPIMTLMTQAKARSMSIALAVFSSSPPTLCG